MAGTASWFFLIIIQRLIAVEIGKCSSATISPISGLCRNTLFNYRRCTGGSSIYAFSSSGELNAWAQTKARILANYSSESCPAETACKKYLPQSTVIKNPTCPQNSVVNACDCQTAAKANKVFEIFECGSDSHCQCAAGFYGGKIFFDGFEQCAECKRCSSNAVASSPCVAGSPIDSVQCSCNAGFFGDGIKCDPCKVCSSQARQVALCAPGSPTDTATCACNAGFYGDGVLCRPCKTCNANAYPISTCAEGSKDDNVVCTCNAGFFGNGLVCNPFTTTTQTVSQSQFDTLSSTTILATASTQIKSTTVGLTLATSASIMSGSSAPTTFAPTSTLSASTVLDSSSSLSSASSSIANSGEYSSALNGQSTSIPQTSLSQTSGILTTTFSSADPAFSTSAFLLIEISSSTSMLPSSSIATSSATLADQTTPIEQTSPMLSISTTQPFSSAALELSTSTSLLSATSTSTSSAPSSIAISSSALVGESTTVEQTSPMFSISTMPFSSASPAFSESYTSGSILLTEMSTLTSTPLSSSTASIETPNSLSSALSGQSTSVEQSSQISAVSESTMPMLLASSTFSKVVEFSSPENVVLSSTRFLESSSTVTSFNTPSPLMTSSDIVSSIMLSTPTQIMTSSSMMFAVTTTMPSVYRTSFDGSKATSGIQGTSAIPFDTSKPVCRMGYFGDGVNCVLCKSCSPYASTSGVGCPTGSTEDGVICTCNAGYYGGGASCTACKKCDSSATTAGECAAGNLADGITCSCNLGFVGSGTSCTSCPTQKWILDYCFESGIGLINTQLYANGNILWCNDETYPICISNYPPERVVFIAGDDDAALSLARSSFLPTSINASTAAIVISTAFRRHAAGFGVPCEISSKGVSCQGVVSLISVPGLLIKTVPGVVYPPKFSLSFATKSMVSTAINEFRSVSSSVIFQSSAAVNVTLGGFVQTKSAVSRRDLNESRLCPSGTEWRYARLGAPNASICDCPANIACSGETACNITPVNGQEWRIVEVPLSLCSGEIPRTSDDSTSKLYPLLVLLSVLLCPVWCLLAYCCRRKQPSKPDPEPKIVWLPAQEQEVHYEPPKVEEIYLPAPNLCPVFIPVDYQRMPEEGSEQTEIFVNPNVPHGFLNFKDYESLSQTEIQVPVPLHYQAFQPFSGGQLVFLDAENKKPISV